MSKGKWLELNAAYRKQIRQYRSELGQLEADETDLSFIRRPNDIDVYLRKKEILMMINHCQHAYQQLGLRLGEKVEQEWLDILKPIEKTVFLLRYEQQLSYPEIKSILGMPEQKTRETLQSVIQKVLKHIASQPQT
ncbi:sigma factor-like helix-turn-helix DNA-binding protein [Brevibacillus brevis]|uniref:sigma factor-like helix-turn-helix DNA-binding protein n=1 Tax=Brevibacillus brevis TaxID=1393 RepID=UPI0025A673A6|nr:sigma factor-like helix-turn-helix DNA-binding protein [Brevibacillus brevis]WJQ84372.1 sigma factor-like helix-turn-helix DNA-binding protein [Brevibacillus brevis]